MSHALGFIPLFLALEAKQVELQFTVGEAISSASVGTTSGAARDPWTCTEDQYSPPPSKQPEYSCQQRSANCIFSHGLYSLPLPLSPVFSSSCCSDLKSNDVVPWVLHAILSKYICSPNPHVRQAACIWLLSLIKKLSQHQEIRVGAPNSSQVEAFACSARSSLGFTRSFFSLSSSSPT